MGFIDRLEAKRAYNTIGRSRLQEILNSGEKITFYDWECPTHQRNWETGWLWANYDINYEKILEVGKRGGRLPDFTRPPRIIFREPEFHYILETLESSGIEFSFLQLIADTNATHIYPKSSENIPKEVLGLKFDQLKDIIQRESNLVFGKDKIKVLRFTELKLGIAELYEQTFKKYYPDTPADHLKGIHEYLFRHLSQDERTSPASILDIAKRVASTYAAEGVLLGKLLTNPVWLDTDEERACAEATQAERLKLGMPELPIVSVQFSSWPKQ